MEKSARCANKIHFTILYGNYCYIFIENLPQKFSPCSIGVSHNACKYISSNPGVGRKFSSTESTP